MTNHAMLESPACYCVSSSDFSAWRKQVVLIFSCRNKPSLSAAVQVSLLAPSRSCTCPDLLLAWFMSRVSQVQMVVSPRGSPSVPVGSPEGLDSKANIEHSRTGTDSKVHTGAPVQCEVSVCRGIWEAGKVVLPHPNTKMQTAGVLLKQVIGGSVVD